jgi:hypothetical protein
MLFLKDLSKNPTLNFQFALAFGIVLGFVPAICIFYRKDDFGGDVWIDKSCIHRKRMVGQYLLWIRYETYTWPFEIIRKCRLIHHSSSGHWFSILELHTENYGLQIGIPLHVDIKALVYLLKSKGIPLEYVGAVPFDELQRGRKFFLLWILSKLALLVVVFAFFALIAWGCVEASAPKKPEAPNPPVAFPRAPGRRPGMDNLPAFKGPQGIRDRKPHDIPSIRKTPFGPPGHVNPPGPNRLPSADPSENRLRE